MSLDVPELWEFHETIYQIWHEAWPEKNITLLIDLIPDIEEGYAKLKEAQLPPILHDKEDKWMGGIKEMGLTIDEYKTAASQDDSLALLKSAEDLHAQFEFLVRAIRPALKELDSFHEELYLLYHFYMPDYNFEKIKISVKELKKRMDLLYRAKLPRRHLKKEKDFNNTRDALLESVSNLDKLVTENLGEEKIVAAIERVHSDYKTLKTVFE
jgi:hypothetical protein